MAGIVSQFSSYFLNNKIGRITGSFNSVRFPDIPCRMARFGAFSGNAGSFFITTDPNVVFGFELDAGQETGWFSTDNLNNFYYGRSSGTTDYLSYWVQS